MGRLGGVSEDVLATGPRRAGVGNQALKPLAVTCRSRQRPSSRTAPPSESALGEVCNRDGQRRTGGAAGWPGAGRAGVELHRCLLPKGVPSATERERVLQEGPGDCRTPHPGVPESLRGRGRVLPRGGRAWVPAPACPAQLRGLCGRGPGPRCPQGPAGQHLPPLWQNTVCGAGDVPRPIRPSSRAHLVSGRRGVLARIWVLGRGVPRGWQGQALQSWATGPQHWKWCGLYLLSSWLGGVFFPYFFFLYFFFSPFLPSFLFLLRA